MKGHHIRYRKCVSQVIPHRDTQRFGLLFGRVGVVCKNIHTKCPAALGYRRPDPSEAEDKDLLAAELVTGKPLPVPFSAPKRTKGLRHLPYKGQHKGHRKFRRRESITCGCVDNHNALAACDRNVDIVHTDTCPCDHLQVDCRVQGFLIHFRSAPGEHCVHFGQFFDQTFAGHSNFFYQFYVGCLP